jgi:hypothetical protein
LGGLAELGKKLSWYVLCRGVEMDVAVFHAHVRVLLVADFSSVPLNHCVFFMTEGEEAEESRYH